MASLSLTMSPKLLPASKPTCTSLQTPKLCNMVTSNVNKGCYYKARRMVAVRASPDVEQSIKSAQETCNDNPESGECAAAWDEVEEISAAASHARDKLKDSDPLETYCKDNPETAECRTYDD